MDALDRMFHVLVRTLRAKNPSLLVSPFTVGELYQQILPYRHFRRELGLETNQEYELVMMELLTGARGYLDVDEQLRDELGKEVTAASPEPSRVREFADAQISINPRSQSAIVDSAPTPAARGRASGASTQSRAPVSTDDAARCKYCGGELPTGRILNFCPHCGQNLQLLNCPGCGAEVEAGWKFCVACGKAVPESLRSGD